MLGGGLGRLRGRLRAVGSGGLRRAAHGSLQALQGFRRGRSGCAGTRSHESARIVLNMEIAVRLNLCRLRAIGRRRQLTFDRFGLFITEKRRLGLRLTILDGRGSPELFALDRLHRSRSELRRRSLRLGLAGWRFAGWGGLSGGALLRCGRCL